MTADNYRIQLGRRIREARTARGFRRGDEFAKALGIDPSQLSRIERGLRKIDSLLLRRIADVLDMPLDELFPANRTVAVLARRGDGEHDQMRAMIDWALQLRRDLDVVAEYVGERTG